MAVSIKSRLNALISVIPENAGIQGHRNMKKKGTDTSPAYPKGIASVLNRYTVLWDDVNDMLPVAARFFGMVS